MKKFLLGLLMFVMLTPGLACGPFMASAKAAQATQSMPIADMPDCKGMGMATDSQKKPSDSGNHVFFKDCSKTDLFSVDHVDLKKPDLSGKVLFLAWATMPPEYNFKPADDNAIRGPPPDWPNLSETQPSILLTTQRFRE